MRKIRFTGYTEARKSCCGKRASSRFVTRSRFGVRTITGTMVSREFVAGREYALPDAEIDFLLQVKRKGMAIFEEII